MGKRQKDPIERPRDELYTHIQRCGVLTASRADQKEWLADTMDYMRERYPHLTDLQFAGLKAMARQYLKPPIPHGAAHHELNRARWTPTQEEAAAELLAKAG